jgi:hypothetical protein
MVNRSCVLGVRELPSSEDVCLEAEWLVLLGAVARQLLVKTEDFMQQYSIVCVDQ